MLKMLLSAIRSIKPVILIWSPSMFRSSLIHPKICIWISGVAKFGVFVEKSLNVSSHIQEHGMKFLPYLPFLFLTEISSFTVGTLYLADEQNHAQKFSCICLWFSSDKRMYQSSFLRYIGHWDIFWFDWNHKWEYRFYLLG